MMFSKMKEIIVQLYTFCIKKTNYLTMIAIISFANLYSVTKFKLIYNEIMVIISFTLRHA